ncbi:MAG: hypothetical protein WDN46_23745 [Methylocella sp.]
MTKNTVPSKTELHEYDLSDATVDVTNLRNLLGTINDLVAEMDLGSGANRNHALARVNSLLRVAEDFADHIRERAEA